MIAGESQTAYESQSLDTVTISGVTLHVVPPDTNGTNPYIDRRELEELILPALSDTLGPPLPVLLHGPPGGGKTCLAYRAAQALGLDFYRFVAHDSVAAEDWLCQGRINAAQVDYVLGPLAAAALRGGLCLIDDAEKAGQGALTGLVSVLDAGSKNLYSVLSAVRIPVHQSFRLMLAVNDVHALPPFIRTRCVAFQVDHPCIEETLRMVRSRSSDIDELEKAFLKAWRTRTTDSRRAISPREAALVFRLSRNLMTAGKSAASATDVALDSVIGSTTDRR